LFSPPVLRLVINWLLVYICFGCLAVLALNVSNDQINDFLLDAYSFQGASGLKFEVRLQWDFPYGDGVCRLVHFETSFCRKPPDALAFLVGLWYRETMVFTPVLSRGVVLLQLVKSFHRYAVS